MTQLPFREYHLLSLLDAYEEQTLPLDLFISHYFRANKALGSKDRGEIAETIYGMMRWQGLIDHLCSDSPSWEQRLTIFKDPLFNESKENKEIPAHVRVSFPKLLFDCIAASHGPEKAMELCLVSNTPAPTMVRANALKTTREKMLERWDSVYEISPSQQAQYGIQFHKKINFFGLPEFREGLFEVQDEGSQLLADLIDAKPGQQVMDYCSGSGGKTLAFAPKMQGKGQIFLHDIRQHILIEARKRLRRAGIQNAQTIQPDSPKLKRLKKQMHWVLVDAPCSGTGTLRRNPDMKWKFTEEMLLRLIGQQRMIFEKALSFMKPEGRIVYATCSLLEEENQSQVEHFIRTYDLEIEQEPFHSLPSIGHMDGFFAVVLKHKTA